MPTYDYVCLICRRTFEYYFRYSEYGDHLPMCPNCGSQNTHRRIGWVRVSRSTENRMEELNSIGSPDSLEALEKDPRVLGKEMRKISGELGEEMGPEFNEIVDRLEKGQHPHEIERDIPTVGLDESSGEL